MLALAAMTLESVIEGEQAWRPLVGNGWIVSNLENTCARQKPGIAAEQFNEKSPVRVTT